MKPASGLKPRSIFWCQPEPPLAPRSLPHIGCGPWADDRRILGLKPKTFYILAGVATLLVLGGGAAFVLKDSTSLSDLHPEMRRIVEEWLRRMRAAGYDVKITNTLRSLETQAARNAAGVSTVSVGYHNSGLAIDYTVKSPTRGWFYPQPNDPPAVLAEAMRLQKAGADIGKALGLRWGGDWEFVDAYHLELKPPGLTARTALDRARQQGKNFSLTA